eukprot:TRINITY_DN18407_c1_g1_i1.p1 TRINITY_DN18407_c1_g1~~TRINITY_DN18407_c1_g1_i1.p1  ORF type:complete len:316 (+),score=64.48 TRINITY_DN18407_c1_g1_i1:54-950(+)
MAATLHNIVVALLASLATGLTWEVKSAAGRLWSEVRNASMAFVSTADSRNLGYKLKLRICNAFPQDTPYDVYLNQDKIQSGLAYSDCFQYTDDLRSGDRINFKVQSLQAGSFTIDTLPREDATLLLVITRHDQKSVSAKFLSHVYASLKDPQIAVLDAFQGDVAPKIQLAMKGTAISEDAVPKSLSVASVMAVAEGAYEVTLGESGKNEKKYELNTWGQEAYAIIRCGGQFPNGKSYPEELLVFPRKALAEPEEDDGNVSKSSNVTKADIEEPQRSAASVALPSLVLLAAAFTFCGLQ